MTNEQEHHPLPLDSDRDLLHRFARRGDEEAFRVIVERHAALVLGVCRRVLGHAEDAEDAWQATFLVLVEKAGALRVRHSLANWLYGVAFRISVRARSKKYRRADTEPLDDVASKEPGVFAQVASVYEQQLLDEELNRMPGKYRDPLVLHYLLGKSAKGISLHLGLTERTVEGRLRRGKQELRQRLAKRGIGFSALISAVTATQMQLQAHVESLKTSARAPTPESYDDPTIIALAKQELGQMAFHRFVLISGIAATFVLTGTIVTSYSLRGQSDVASTRRGVTELGTAVLAGPLGADTPIRVAAAPQNSSNADPFGVREPGRAASGNSTRSNDPFGEVDEAQPPADDTSLFGDGVPSGASAQPRPSNSRSRSRRNTRAAILPLLDSKSIADFTETPLTEILDLYRDFHNVNIVLDPQAAEKVKLSRQPALVSLELRDVTFKYALRKVLEPLGLDFVVESEAIKVTTQEKAATAVYTRVYDLPHDSGQDMKAIESLPVAIRSTIRPATWKSFGEKPTRPGGNPPVGVIDMVAGKLIITQSQRVHEEIDDLLDQLFGGERTLHNN